MSKHAVSALAALRPILPTHLQAGEALTRAKVRRTPGIPFFRDPGHTIPTRGLYRRLLRYTSPVKHDKPTTISGKSEMDVAWDALRKKVKADWRKRRGWTSIPQTQAFLDTQRAFLHTVTGSNTDNDHHRNLVELSHRLAGQQHRAAERALPKPGVKPYVAGFVRPSFSNPPIPRLKPQPLSVTLTILSRVRARARRVALQKDLAGQSQDLKEEINFYRRVRDREGLEETKAFLADLRARQADLQALFDRHERRKSGVFGEGVVRRVVKAKKDRQAFKRFRAEEGHRLAQNGVGQDSHNGIMS